jgi:hypothetical protein
VTLGVVITLLALTAALSALSLRRRPDV